MVMTYQATTTVNGSAKADAINEKAMVEIEATPKAKRRSFNAAYKRRILREAEQCEHGQVGALLRREGLYSSHLATWRQQEATDQLLDSKAKKRGKQPKYSAQEKDMAKLQRENERLKTQLKHAGLIRVVPI